MEATFWSVIFSVVGHGLAQLPLPPQNCDVPNTRVTGLDVQGPYYKPNSPQQRNQQGMPVICREDLPGTRLFINGTVQIQTTQQPCGVPVRVMMDAWSADVNGEYSNISPGSPDFTCRSRFISDASGRFAVTTILPGRYIDFGGWRPSHIHWKLTPVDANNRPLGKTSTHQLYFAEADLVVLKDARSLGFVMNKTRSAWQRMAVAKFVPRPLSQTSVKRDKRSTYAKEYEKLLQQTSNALRDIGSTTEQLASALQQEYPDIAESLRHITGQRFESSHKKERHGVENRLERLNSSVLRVGEAMKSATTSNQGVEELQALMRNINEDLYEAKVESNNESSKLNMEESQLTHELKALHKDIDGWTKWDTASEEHECPHSKQSIKEINSTRPEAVVKFEEFCGTHGGMTGGWEHLDHNEFLAFRLQRGPLTEKLAEEASSTIPTKSPVEIFRHEEWYRKFHSLVESKKEAVSGWKRTKCQQQKEAAELAAQKTKLENERNAERAKLENEKKKLLVDADKVEKRKMEEQKSAEATKIMAEQSEKARQRFLEHQNLLKSRLDDHYEKVHQRFSKIQMEEENKLEELKQRRLEATLQVAELASKEIIKAKNEVSKKKQFSLEKAAVQARRKRLAEQLREKAAKNVRADPQRLNQHTEAWNHRLDAKLSEGTANESGDHVLRNWEAQLDIFNSPKLKLPDWRTQAS